MSDDPRMEHEIVRTLMAAVDGAATSQELALLNEQLQANPQLAAVVVETMNQEAFLRWFRTKSRGDAPLRPELLASILAAATASTTQPLAATITLSPSESTGTPAARWRRSQLAWLSLAAAAVIAVGWVGGFRYASHQFDEQRLAAVPLEGPALGSGGDQPRYVARFVRQTACLWNADDPAAFDSDHALRMGESLRLLEGIAEVQFDWLDGRATLQIEGPAGLVLTAERGASLSHGRLTAEVHADDSRFRLDTPNARIEVSDDASVGVVVAGDKVQLHVFRGRAVAVIPWADDRRGPRRAAVRGGRSLCVAATDEGSVQLERGAADAALFASEQSMASDALLVTEQYARGILADKPLVYWRFEDADDGRVANVAGDRFHGRIMGTAAHVQQRENHVLDLGSSLDEAAFTTYVVSDEPVTEKFPTGYAVEAWIKPSHYHWCSLTALVCPPPQPGWRHPHAFLLELGGPRAADSPIERAGRVRFLHRSPPSDVVASGTSLYSQSPYDVRKWQHVVAAKEGDRLCLYVNGEIVAEGVDATTLPTNWTIVLGQLDQEQTYRRFIGQIDEFAIYPRPLSAADVHRHYELVRRPAAKQNEASARDRTVFAPRETPWTLANNLHFGD